MPESHPRVSLSQIMLIIMQQAAKLLAIPPKEESGCKLTEGLFWLAGWFVLFLQDRERMTP